jgi:hypothetical protein
MTLTLFKYAYEFVIDDLVNRYPGFATWSTLFYKFSLYLVPFTYGTLGACAHGLRLVGQQLRDREFDPRRVPQHKNRLVLGTLSGGIIVIFVKAGESSTLGVELTAAALGFLAGYSSDMLFETVDRILDSFLPAKEKSASPGTDTTRRVSHVPPVAPLPAPPKAASAKVKPKDKPASEQDKGLDNVLKSIKTHDE